MVRSTAAMALDFSMKTEPQAMQGTAQGSSGPGDARRCQREIHGAPDPPDAELFTQPRNGVQHWRQQVRVLVSVPMRGLDAGIQTFSNLRLEFLVHGNT